MDLSELGRHILEAYKEQLKANDKIASGTLYNSTYEVEIKDGHYLVSLMLPSYWEAVEYGRKPGKFPPLDAIRDWIKIKPVIPSPSGNKVPTTNQLAFLISRSISINGTKGVPVLSKALDDSQTYIDEFVNFILDGVQTEILKLI